MSAKRGKKKRPFRFIGRDQRIRRKRNLQSQCHKSIECRKIIDSKHCELCRKNDNGRFILCDECDDAYHMTCLQPVVNSLPEGIWLCPNCVKLEQELILDGKMKPVNCEKCGERLDREFELKYELRGVPQCQVIDQVVPLQCLHCQKWFHEQCFSHRPSSLNCSSCEWSIRRDCPKSHQEFLNFIHEEFEKVRKSGYVRIFDQNPSARKPKGKTSWSMQLSQYPQPTHWEPITRYEASLYYALKTKKLTFCDEQLYHSVESAQMNDSLKEILPVLPLHESDETTYEEFKAKLGQGVAAPFQIKQDRRKGFYVQATAELARNSIICEYAGEVCCHRESLKQVDNDSIFTLLTVGSSQEDLNIIPSKFGNIGRFICGINNNSKQQKRLLNVKAVRFSYKGRMRIIIVAKKAIERGDHLYLDYNAGTYEEYPTDNFV